MKTSPEWQDVKKKKHDNKSRKEIKIKEHPSTLADQV